MRAHGVVRVRMRMATAHSACMDMWPSAVRAMLLSLSIGLVLRAIAPSGVYGLHCPCRAVIFFSSFQVQPRASDHQTSRGVSMCARVHGIAVLYMSAVGWRGGRR